MAKPLHIESRSTVGAERTPELPAQGWDHLLAHAERLGPKSFQGLSLDWFLGVDRDGLCWLLGTVDKPESNSTTVWCLVGGPPRAMRMAWEQSEDSKGGFWHMQSLVKPLTAVALEAEALESASAAPPPRQSGTRPRL